ncbi:hypothetical protein EC968_008744 [Mortierella alpina]|nr:hypothetical protein EC968_008744 [Mortierella alpina]
MSQNIVRPDYISLDGPATAHLPLSITINSSKPLTNDAINTMASATPRSYTKIPPPAIQTTLLNIKSNSDSNTSPGSISPPSTSSATTSSPSSATASSPMNQLRRWTSSLSSPGSKTSSPKSTLKVRTIGPISAPQPLTTPVPYACTPLPYSDSPSSPGLISPLRTESSTFTVPRSPARATTLCPDSPAAPLSPTPSASPATAPTFSSVARTSHRTSWKDRIFSSSNIKKENRRASTNSNVDDDYEWSSPHQYSDMKAATAAAAAARAAQKAKPRMRISPPLTQPILPANQKTVPILSAISSPTDGVYGPDFTETKPAPLSPPIDIAAQPVLGPVSPVKTASPHSEQSVDVQVHRLSTSSTGSAPETNGDEGHHFLADKNSSVRAMAPSYFDSKSSNRERNEALSRCPENENEKPSRTRTPLRIRPSMIKRTSRASSSSYTTSSDSSDSSAESESDSDSDSSDSEQTSPISGASFFSTPPNVTSVPSSTALSAALLKSGGIKIPSSLITLASSSKAKATTPSITITPPTTPPLESEFEPTAKVDCNAPSAAVSSSTSCPASNQSDPRASTLKRVVYMHTWRKLREREKRPFRHAVLLQLLLLQLHRGVTSQHCQEIGEFYAALSVAQFSPRMDFANALIMAHHQQGRLLQQQEEKAIAHAKRQEERWNQTSPVIPLRSTSKGAKVSKAKRSLVSSIQSRIQASRAFNSSSSASSIPSTIYSPTPLSALKDRLPLLRASPAPVLNSEKKSPIAHASLAAPAHGQVFHAASDEPISPPSSDPSDSEEDEEDESDDSDKDEGSNSALDSTVHEITRPTPTIIVPKRTTGRKGVLYQQQLQLQLQMQSLLAHPNGQSSMTAIDQASQEAAAAWIQAQLVGSRPQFATSTYTTICAVGSGELITKPLVGAPEPSASLPSKENTQSNTNASSSRDGNRVEDTVASQRPDTASAGLLTPPLSPLLRSSFPTSQTAVTSHAPTGPKQTWHSCDGMPAHIQSRRYTMDFYSMQNSTSNSPVNHRTSFEGITAPVALSGRQRQKSHPAEYQHSSKVLSFGSFSLPSPPLSPTLESEDLMANTLSRPATHGRSHLQAGRGSMGRYENIPLINQIAAQESQMRLYKDDMRSRMRKQQQIQMMMNVRHKRKFSNGNGDNCRIGEESEEDMPLALVQKRISSEALRSSA